MQIFGISSKSLDEYITTANDLRRAKSRMPPQKYLISAAQSDSDGEDEMWDDWVLVDWEPKQRLKPEEEVENEEEFNLAAS